MDDYGFLEENGIYYLVPWILPTGKYIGSAKINNGKALSAGLSFQPLPKTVKDTYDWWYSDAITQEQRDEVEQNPKGILQREAEILARWQAKK